MTTIDRFAPSTREYGAGLAVYQFTAVGFYKGCIRHNLLTQQPDTDGFSGRNPVVNLPEAVLVGNGGTVDT